MHKKFSFGLEISENLYKTLKSSDDGMAKCIFGTLLIFLNHWNETMSETSVQTSFLLPSECGCKDDKKKKSRVGAGESNETKPVRYETDLTDEE